MGCSGSRGSLSEGVEDNFLDPFEKQLGYSSIATKEMDAIFHRYSLNNCMNYYQLTKALTAAGIRFDNLKRFYGRFNLNTTESSYLDSYSTLNLNCIGIVLGKGTVEMKVKILFQTFDVEATKVLGLDKLLMLLDSVLSIALFEIPQYCANAHKREDSLYKYLLSLIVSRRKVLENFFDLFTHTNHEITYKEFENTFANNKLAAKLFSTRELRLYAFHIAKDLERSDPKIATYFAANGASYSKKEINLLKKNSDREINELIQEQELGCKAHLKKKKKNALIFSKLLSRSIAAPELTKSTENTVEYPAFSNSSFVIAISPERNSDRFENVNIDFTSIKALNDTSRKQNTKKNTKKKRHQSTILCHEMVRSLVGSPIRSNNSSFTQEVRNSKRKNSRS